LRLTHRIAFAASLLAVAAPPAWSQDAAGQPAPAATAAQPAPAQPPPQDPDALALYQRVIQIDQANAARQARAEITLAKAVSAFYRERRYAPAWTAKEDVEQLLASLRGLAEDGLDPEDFRTGQLSAAWIALSNGTPTPMQKADFDVLATSAYIDAMVQLARGKIDPLSLDPGWNFAPEAIDPAQGLAVLLGGVDQHQVAAAFAKARPASPIYARLRGTLAQLRQQAGNGGWPAVPDGPVLKPGMDDPRVAALRLRLAAGGYLAQPLAGAGDRYDGPVQEAVRSFQREQYLDADGHAGQATLAALNVPIQTRIDQLKVNLERARWLLHELKGTFVVVDIAGYKIAYYRDGQPVWRSRVQVGMPYRSTPIFRSEITYVTFNPTWTVPPTILRKDIIPKIRQDPNYLAANRIRVLDAEGHTVPASSVNWNNPRGITLRQDAGPGNSLGQVVIRFPNPFSVYLHDTPHRELFDRKRRDTSSGCIRVENPLELVQLLFDDADKWNPDTIARQLATGKTHSVRLPAPVPILLAYWTVDVGDDGRVAYKPDVYGRDAELLGALDRPRPMPVL
jgi:murein L,D-transpeptidase YcbB/YkuD